MNIAENNKSRRDQKTVLLIEDDHEINLSIREILEDEGHNVVCAFNGLEGIKILESGVMPALILLDLMMPIMNGSAFYLEKQKNIKWASIPAVLLSAGNDVASVGEALGGLTVIRKPIELSDLYDVVNKFCR